MTDHPTCDFDCWTRTDIAKSWLVNNNATKLRTAYGFDFWENPLLGDEAPVLATKEGERAVWNTQDFDLPVRDPMEAWEEK